ncbi:MAG TPA: amidohydrolase family protein [Candidatus Acidoferrales bacterium]|nr:amidohydrolase family protein [Candidatus Acidoferrales bacterium]
MKKCKNILYTLLLLEAVLALCWRASVAAEGVTLALVGATIDPSPTDAPIAHGIVLIRDGRIAAFGQTGSVHVPADAKKLDCTGLFITAGFQNSHVHFTEPKWDQAGLQSAEKLSLQLQQMLTRYGFTSVVDTGSTLANTVALRSRIESGDVPGPRIRTAGSPVYPSGGTPFYLKDTLPPAILAYIESSLEPATPDAGVAVVRQDIAGGADVIKLFTGSLATHTKVVPMDIGVARAAVREAHAQARLVFAHPSNREGLEIALNAGVDVAAHTTPMSGDWDHLLTANMKRHQMSLIPTLKLWIYEASRGGATPEQAQRFADQGVGELRQYEQIGGQILFGTDVGYMTDYDPTEEYVLMGSAGLTPMQILDSLTTAPAARFGESHSRGRISAGMEADIVVLGSDPTRDVRNFAVVRYTIRKGNIIYPIPNN